MESNQLRQMKYLVQSHEPWKPDKLAVSPWETGLIPQCIVDDVIKRTTTQLYVAGIYDRTNDAR